MNTRNQNRQTSSSKAFRHSIRNPNASGQPYVRQSLGSIGIVKEKIKIVVAERRRVAGESTTVLMFKWVSM